MPHLTNPSRPHPGPRPGPGPGSSWLRLAQAALSFLMIAMMFACKPPARLAFADLEYPAPLASTQTLQVGSATVAYVDQGQGQDTLVLIHGLGSYLPAWKNNVAALAQHHRVVAIDLPGYGKSSKDDDYAYSMEFFATVVQGVIEQLELSHPVLVGHSMGGQIAVTHALRYPGAARALVLTSPAGLETFEDGEAKWLADIVTDEFTCKATPEAIWSRHATNFHHMPKDAHFMAADRVAVIGGPDFQQYCRAVTRSVRAMLDEPVFERLPEVTVPVLVVFGKYDQLIPNPFLHGGSTERLAKKTVPRLPAAELVMLPRAGHMAQLEQAEAWNEAVLAFLGRLPPAPLAQDVADDSDDTRVSDDAAASDDAQDGEPEPEDESALDDDPAPAGPPVRDPRLPPLATPPAVGDELGEPT